MEKIKVTTNNMSCITLAMCHLQIKLHIPNGFYCKNELYYAYRLFYYAETTLIVYPLVVHKQSRKP